MMWNDTIWSDLTQHDAVQYGTIRYNVIRYDTIIAAVLQGLEAAVKKTVSGDVGALLLNLLMPPREHDAYRFQQAMAVSMLSAYMVGYLCVHSRINTHIVRLCAGFRYRRGDADRDLVSAIQKAAWWHQCCVQILWVITGCCGDWNSKVSLNASEPLLCVRLSV